MNGRRTVSYGGTTVVAGIAAYASYEHMRALAATAGQSAAIAASMPLSVDGLIVVCSVALVDGRTRKGSAWFGFVAGVLVSIAANVAAAGPSLLDRAVSAWPSVALLIVVEVIARGGRTSPAAGTSGQPENPPGSTHSQDLRPGVGRPAPKARNARRDSSADRVRKAAARTPAARPAELAARLGVSESTIRRHMPRDPAADHVNGADVAEPAIPLR